MIEKPNNNRAIKPEVEQVLCFTLTFLIISLITIIYSLKDSDTYLVPGITELFTAGTSFFIYLLLIRPKAFNSVLINKARNDLSKTASLLSNFKIAWILSAAFVLSNLLCHFSLGFDLLYKPNNAPAGVTKIMMISMLLSFCGRASLVIILTTIFSIFIAQSIHIGYFGIPFFPSSIDYVFLTPWEIIHGIPEQKILIIKVGLIAAIPAISIPFLNKISKNKKSTEIATMLILLPLIYDINEKYSIPDYPEKPGHNHNDTDLTKALLLPETKYTGIKNAYRSISYRLIDSKQKNTYKLKRDDISIDKIEKQKGNIILIIGESLRASSLQILGGEKPTNPELSKYKSLKARPIISAGTMTKTSFPAIINLVRPPSVWRAELMKKQCLFHLAKRSGYETTFITAQSRQNISIIKNMICKNDIDNFIHREDLGQYHTDDMILPKAIERKVNKKSQFIVLHMRGSHIPYQDNYPEDYAKFSTSYYNTALYSDHVLSSIISRVKDSNETTHLIFTSDHGEIIPEDNLDIVGHGHFHPLVTEVPLVYFTNNSENTMHRIFLKSRNHFEMARNIAILMGYDVSGINENYTYVNGIDINGFAGQKKTYFDKINRISYTD